MEAQDEGEQAIVHGLVVDYHVLGAVVVEIGEGFEDERIVEMLAGVEGNCFVSLFILEVADIAHYSAAGF